MSQKSPCLKIKVPTYISYTLGMTFQNIIFDSIRDEPKLMETLKLRSQENGVQTVSLVNILDLINQDTLEPDESDIEDD